MKRLIIIFLIGGLCNAAEYAFPEDFTFGVASSAYQIEGAWNEDGKGESIWDYAMHNTECYSFDCNNGDVACDSYHKTEEDVQLLKNLGVNFYRFSISWSRILPTGHINNINGAGIAYYSNLIDTLLENEIEPWVTMYHWDLPQPLQELGGWPNPLLANYFADYADLLFRTFGDRVKNWITFNEPVIICKYGYSTGGMAPGYAQYGIGGYLCGYTVLISHARAYHNYNDNYRSTQEGKVGITLDTPWFAPASSSEDDQTASVQSLEMYLGWFAHPIFSDLGNWPDYMTTTIDALSSDAGYSKSRLPAFTAEEVELVKGSSDFFGINHYGTQYCRLLTDDDVVLSPSMAEDTGTYCEDSGETLAGWGFRNLLNWIKDQYGNPEVRITENGASDTTGILLDCERVDYYNTYLEAVLEAIHVDGCNIQGYAAWSFVDNLEWRLGYSTKYGLYHVDFEDEDRPRTPKMSSYVYKNIIETRTTDLDYVPEGYPACSALSQYAFPSDFIFGVATSAYQVEGAWDTDGKGENIWDYLTHTTPSAITDENNGDIACDTYHKTAEDVQLLKNLGVDFYRFSLSWSRILPTGHADYINPLGVAYYNELIDELIANDITPLVTIFHWDLPQPLQEIGGWPNPLLVDEYVDYAEVVFGLFGDRVKDWITFNEPYQICQEGYSEANKAPAYNHDGTVGYLCAYTVLLAHAKSYRLYEENFKEQQQGRVGFTVHGIWAEPDSDSEADAEAAENHLQFHFGIYFHPIYSETGDFPEIVKTRVSDISEKLGFSRTRLPTFTPEEIQIIKGSSDFLGFNHYSTDLCKAADYDGAIHPSNQADTGASCYKSEDWESAASSWVKVVPEGFRKLLNWIKVQYDNPPVLVTENGFSTFGDDLQDCRRINYYNVYLKALLEAIHEDGCNVIGYTAWSFLDNFEWMDGYLEKFGLHMVDFSDPNRARTPKMSAYIYKNIINTRRTDTSYTPEGFEECIFDES